MSDDRTFPARPVLGASIAVFRDGKVLLAQRGRPPLEGVWSLPGGVVELGETLEEAALRELAEETGVTAESAGLAGHVDVIRHDEAGRVERHFVVVALAGRYVSGEPFCGDGTLAVRWVPLDEMERLALTEGAAPIIRRAAALADGGQAVGARREDG